MITTNCTNHEIEELNREVEVWAEFKLCLAHWVSSMRCILKGELQNALEYHASAECPVEVLFP